MTEDIAAIQRTLAKVRRDNVHWRIAFVCAMLLSICLGTYVVLDLVLFALRA